MYKIGVLHPGEMGVSIAASAINTGHWVYWVSTGRSEQTRLRAERQNLIEKHSLSELCHTCEIIISICPPHAAEEVAKQVIADQFQGIYLDANAISPQRSKKLCQIMEENKIHFIDGSIIGGPAWKPAETFLYLSGKGAESILECFQNGPLEARVISIEMGKASALKMCYAAYSKGLTALLASILATADVFDISEELYQQWDRDNPGFSEQAKRKVLGAADKAWRFTNEMEEIAATFEEAGLPGGFHHAAAEIFRQMASLKSGSPVSLDQLLAILSVQRA